MRAPFCGAVSRFLLKPWNERHLRQTVAELLELSLVRVGRAAQLPELPQLPAGRARALGARVELHGNTLKSAA